jgi:hypothetical protein
MKNNDDRFRKWINSTGFGHTKYKFVAVDTTDPLSVLAVSGLDNFENMVVLALIADSSSTPMSQNTSYVTLKLIEKKKLPVIVVSKDYISDMPFFIEDTTMTINTDPLSEINSLFVSCVSHLIDFVARDLKLGIAPHCLSAVLSASDMVYESPEIALSLLQRQTSLCVDSDHLQTAYLFGRADKSVHEDLSSAFKKRFNNRKSRLLNSGVKLIEKQSAYRLYDLVILFGIKEVDLGALEKGYNLVASKNPDLKVKST